MVPDIGDMPPGRKPTRPNHSEPNLALLSHHFLFLHGLTAADATVLSAASTQLSRYCGARPGRTRPHRSETPPALVKSTHVLKVTLESSM